ncbi:circularly permuted type 2 ATP-grasp protein [Sporichthya polymorpha]|uniref:circularly permuted type 2 ATP-grasp protein n=1 Tax=Sporichthya polymorpha TaxID=35751 RepID=UPI0003665846|nr:circularly permuted type 2 ATP-grasp protein [Sporichthya polymorpha]
MTAGSESRTDASGMVHAYAARRSGNRTERARWDEMVGFHGRVRRGWRELSAVAESLGPSGLAAAAAEAHRLLEEDGVTYRPLGAPEEQTWVLDPLPVFVDEAEWAMLEPGLIQRANLLETLLHDLYGPRNTLRSGVLPNELVHAHPGFLRVWDGVATGTARQLFLAAADLARAADGTWCVLADRVQAPSGAGYAMANRRVVSRVLPGLHREAEIHRLGPFFHAMRIGLEQVAPPTAEAPRAVLLTPGAGSETAFEQAYLSTLLGYPLVRGEDLVVADGRVWQQTLGRLEQVDVILRRVDSWYCDPLDLRPDSELGVPGLVEAARAGSVSLVNGLGCGVLENPGLLPFLPALCQTLLDEPLRLKSVPTWWCGDEAGLAKVRASLPEMVIKPLARGISRTRVHGWELTAQQREDLLRRIESEPYAWVGQESLPCSTAPSIIADDLFPQDLTLRTFAVASGASFQVMTGGLGQVRTSPALTDRQVLTTKDVWIRNTRGAPTIEPWVREATPSQVLPLTITPRVTEDMFWLGRYAERAEDTARLVRAVNDRWADFHHSPERTGAAALAVLLETLTRVTATTPGFLGVDADTRFAGRAGELLSLVLDEEREGTLAFAVRRLTEVSGDVREQLSTDTWLVLGGLERELDQLRRTLRGRQVLTPDVPTAIARVLEGLLALSGLIAESLVRDAGWRFCEIGRRVERALHVTALLEAAVTARRAPQTDSLVLESVLIAAESIITYRRRYQARAGVGTMLDLLLADRENPRAVAYQLDRLGEALERIPAESERISPVRDALAEIRAIIRNADTVALARAEEDGTRPGLRDLLSHLNKLLSTLAVDVERIFFVQPAPQRPLDVTVSTWEAW